MWPFKKPELNGNLIFSVRYMYSDCSMDISDKFMKTLTRKQIKMLNAFAEDAHRSENLEKEIEEEMHQEFTDEERIKSDEDYANYLNNNHDKAMLTEDEEKRLMNMLAGFNKKESEINKRLSELEGKSAKEGE